MANFRTQDNQKYSLTDKRRVNESPNRNGASSRASSFDQGKEAFDKRVSGTIEHRDGSAYTGL